VQAYRSAALINWWLMNLLTNDSRNRRKLFLVYDRAGKIVAYFLVKARFFETATHRNYRNLLLGSIADWMVLEKGAISMKQILLLAMNELNKMDVDAVEFCTADPELARAPRWLGFVRVGSLNFMYRAAPKSVLADPDLAKLDRWWIRPGDGDNLLI